MLFLVGCAQKEDTKVEKFQEPSVPEDYQKPLPSTSQSQGLGSLCFGEEECISFCLNNRVRCEEYCKGNEKGLCKIIFPPQEEREQTEKLQEMKPVLKNLGINIQPWDRQTNRAGDLVFLKNLLFNDGFINNEKVFLGFGEFDHIINNPDKSVEYWWFLSPGTKVRAAVDGVVGIGFIEHTKDWGVSIAKGWTTYGAPIGSKWIVSFEHLVNLEVKDGDIVKAGDILGESSPRKFSGEDLGFVELAVWTGGNHIYKYCPFEFLDESLKPIYEEKINQLAKDWEEFIGKDVYKQEDWVAPGCLLHNITER